VPLLELKLGGVLDGDDPLALRNERRQRVQHGRLARAGTTGDDAVELGLHAGGEKRQHLSVALLIATMSLTRNGEPPKRRIESTGRSMASGGMMALTRAPSGRRASAIGDDSSMRRPTRDTMRTMICCRCALSRKRTGVSSNLPNRST